MLDYEVSGSGDSVIVFINGAGVSSWMWDKQREPFNSYKCIFFDLPGHGKNSSQNFKTIDSCIVDIKKIINKESPDKKVVIVGLSIGAQIGLKMLKNCPELLKKAVIVSGLNYPIKGVTKLLKPMVELSLPLMKYPWFSKLQAKEFGIKTKDLFNLYYKDSLLTTKETLINILMENSSFRSEALPENSIPTLILVGEKEKKIMHKSAENSLRDINSSKISIIKGVGHGAPYEDSEQFNQIIKDFLE